jgi:hypothetical protein
VLVAARANGFLRFPAVPLQPVPTAPLAPGPSVTVPVVVKLPPLPVGMMHGEWPPKRPSLRMTPPCWLRESKAMASQRLIAANRRNGAKRCGPPTQEGKARPRMNCRRESHSKSNSQESADCRRAVRACARRQKTLAYCEKTRPPITPARFVSGLLKDPARFIDFSRCFLFFERTKPAGPHTK